MQVCECVLVHVCLYATVVPSIINSPYLIQDPVFSYAGECSPRVGKEMEL